MALSIGEMRERFGLSEKRHRIGSLDLRMAQVERVDDMVMALYPDAVILHGDAPVWMITWPAAYGLAEYLLLNMNLAGLRVLELGCGTAAPGIAAAKAGARALCTDYDENALALAAYNARLNGCGAAEFAYLDWYRPDITGTFDLIIGSDVVYFEKSFLPLIALLKGLAASGCRVVLSDQERPQMNHFLKLCAEHGFTWVECRRMVHLPDLSRAIRIITLTLEC